MESPINPQVGDVLYLMATVERAEGLTESQLSGLSAGSAALVHGDMPAALAGFDIVLAAPDLNAGHPEAYLFPWNHPHYARLRLAGDAPAEGGGLPLFRNAVAFAHAHLA